MSISSDNIRPCDICDRTYNHDRLTTCPRCKGDKDYLSKRTSKNLDDQNPRVLLSYVRPCAECGNPYNHVQLSECPSCKNSANGNEDSNKSASSPTKQAAERNEELQNLLRELVNENRLQRKAIDRTTYAVRAMVSYTVITAITLLLGGLFVGFMVLAGGGSFSVFFGVIAGLIFIVGNIYAFSTLVREWSMSEVTNR